MVVRECSPSDWASLCQRPVCSFSPRVLGALAAHVPALDGITAAPAAMMIQLALPLVYLPGAWETAP